MDEESRPKEKDLISQVTKYLPVLSLYSLSFGMINLTYYYRCFNINILFFLEMDEILNQTLTDFYKVTAIVLVTATAFGLFNRSSDEDEVLTEEELRQKRLEMREKRNSRNYKRKWTNLKIFRLIMLSIVMCFLIYPTWYLGFETNNKLDSPILLISIVSWVVCLVVTLTYEGHYQITKRYPTRQFQIITLSGAVTIIMAIFVAEIRYRNLFKNELKISITVGQKPIKSTSTNYYIGRTKNYVFFYNVSSNSTDVYPTSTISKYTIYDN